MPLISGFEKSQHAREIRQMVAQAKADDKPLLAVYREVKALDPNVPNYSRFLSYAKRIVEMIPDVPNTDEALLEQAIQRSIRLGDLVLEQTLLEMKGLVEAGKVIPWEKKKELMKWFNDSGNMKLRKKFLDIKNKQGMASIAAMALLADAARYGKLKGEDVKIIEGQIEEDVQITEDIPTIDGAGESADSGVAAARE